MRSASVPQENIRIRIKDHHGIPGADAFIEVAARAQMCIDQAISGGVNLGFLNVDEMMNRYSAAWERGVKTT